MREVSRNRCFGGSQLVVAHDSEVLGCEMRLGIYLPPGADRGDCPVLTYLSGLTCTEQNVITKAGAQRVCAELGIILVTPDTSPRGEGVADDEGWDLGQGAGFYVDATEEPWSRHYRMDSYVTQELPGLTSSFTSHPGRGITGHSMGGHGALVLSLRNPGMYQSVSAFAPITNPSEVPWGHKAFGAYLGADRSAWAAYDATELVRSVQSPPILIDQGGADSFLEPQLDATAFLAAAKEGGTEVHYRLREGYDHSYYFVASFIEEHVQHHASVLRRTTSPGSAKRA